jgi:hypothetical protein
MMYNVEILKGAGQIKFGMSFSEVRKKISGIYKSYDISNVIQDLGRIFPVDYYAQNGIFCHYDPAGLLEAIEFLSPSRPLLQGVDILSLTTEQAVSLLRQLDPSAEWDGEGLTSHRLSLDIRSPQADDGDHILVERFLVGCPGYYDSTD